MTRIMSRYDHREHPFLIWRHHAEWWIPFQETASTRKISITTTRNQPHSSARSFLVLLGQGCLVVGLTAGVVYHLVQQQQQQQSSPDIIIIPATVQRTICVLWQRLRRTIVQPTKLWIQTKINPPCDSTTNHSITTTLRERFRYGALVGVTLIASKQQRWMLWSLGGILALDGIVATFFGDQSSSATKNNETLHSPKKKDPFPTTTTTTTERTIPRVIPPPPPAVVATGPTTTTTTTTQHRYVEILVHNISHTDLVFSMDAQDDQGYCLCRPRFSCFDKYTRAVLNALDNDTLIDFPRYQRSIDSPRYSIEPQPSTLLGASPTGLALANPTLVQDSSEIRIRGRDQARVNENKAYRLSHVFFPILATLWPRWQQQIAFKQHSSRHQLKRVLVLVTGVGTPRNWTHSATGNSTEACADLMEHFLRFIDPELVVVKVHSPAKYNIFRYDDNLLFCQRTLMPLINSYRDAHATGHAYPDERDSNTPIDWSSFSRDWRKSFSLTLSFADGSPARTHAIQASLRVYRPTYFHVWQLKTFWHESKLVNDDMEVHSFEEMESIPAVAAVDLPEENYHRVLRALAEYRDEVRRTLQQQKNDLYQFWLRKTHKPVLAVLLAELPDGKYKVYRGSNMEVSMPTGSLCAERNVIGTALAENPGLRRQDLKLMAVLAVPPPPTEDELPRTCSVASLEEEYINIAMHRKNSLGSDADEVSLSDWVVPDDSPVRRIHLFPSTASKKKRVMVVPSTDTNPLSPCGACEEWLKKIAECNPYFSILTFTDVNLQGVYCTPCQGE